MICRRLRKSQIKLMETITKPGHSENSRQRQKKKLDDEHEIIDRLSRETLEIEESLQKI